MRSNRANALSDERRKFNALPSAIKDSALKWETDLLPIVALKHGTIMAAQKELAARLGCSFKAVAAKTKAYREGGILGLVNRSLRERLELALDRFPTSPLSTPEEIVEVLPLGARADFLFWARHLEPLLATSADGITAQLAAVAEQIGVPEKTVRKRYYRFRKEGYPGLVEKRLAGPAWWDLCSSSDRRISEEDKALVHAYCVGSDDGATKAIQKLKADWKSGVVTTSTAVNVETGFPCGWSLRNLLRFAPSDGRATSLRKAQEVLSSDAPESTLDACEQLLQRKRQRR